MDNNNDNNNDYKKEKKIIINTKKIKRFIFKKRLMKLLKLIKK